MNLTEIQKGKRVVIQSPLFDGSIDKITQVFRECKIMEESSQGWAVDLKRYKYFSIMAKSGINKISILLDKEHEYPHFVLGINNNHKFRWEYQHDISATLLWVRKHNHPNITDPYLGLEGVLNEIIDSVRKEWSTN